MENLTTTAKFVGYTPVEGFGPACLQGVEGHTYKLSYRGAAKGTLEIVRTDRWQVFDWIVRAFRSLLNGLRKLVGMEPIATARDEVRKAIQTGVDYGPIVKALKEKPSAIALVTMGDRAEFEAQTGKQAECAFPRKSFVFGRVDTLRAAGDHGFMFEGSGGEIKYNVHILKKHIETNKVIQADVKYLSLIREPEVLKDIYKTIKKADNTLDSRHVLNCVMAENSALPQDCINDLITTYSGLSKDEQCALYGKLAANKSTSVENTGRIVEFVQDNLDTIAPDKLKELQKTLIEKGSLSPDSIRTLFSMVATEPESVGKLHFWQWSAKAQARNEMKQRQSNFFETLLNNENLPANSIEALYAGLIRNEKSLLFGVYKNLSKPKDTIDFSGFSDEECLKLGASLAGHSSVPKELFNALFDTVIDGKACMARVDYLTAMMRSSNMTSEQAETCLNRAGVMPPVYKKLLLAPGEGKAAFKFNRDNGGTDEKETNRLVGYLEANGSDLNLNSKEEREQAAKEILRNVSSYYRPKWAFFSSTAPLTDSLIKDIDQHDFRMLNSAIEGPVMKHGLMDEFLVAIESDDLMADSLKAELFTNLLYRYAVRNRVNALLKSDGGVRNILGAAGKLPAKSMDNALHNFREKEEANTQDCDRLARLLPSNEVVQVKAGKK